MTPDEAEYVRQYLQSLKVAERFCAMMLAAALRDDEEAVRIAILEAFEHDHDVHPVVVPVLVGVGLGLEEWGLLVAHPDGQERIYLD